MEKNKLIIFAKQPELGKVKTRLSASIGEERTLKIYLELLEITKSVTYSLDIDKIVYWNHLTEVLFDGFGSGYRAEVQEEGDLGWKMQIAFQNEFQTKPNKVLIIGTDCPFLTTEILYKAYQSLDQTDFVLGPARDGGYYLLGMKEFSPYLFHSIPWSTKDVLSLTLAKIQNHAKTVSLLDELDDIDEIDDLNYWKSVN